MSALPAGEHWFIYPYLLCASTTVPLIHQNVSSTCTSHLPPLHSTSPLLVPLFYQHLPYTVHFFYQHLSSTSISSLTEILPCQYLASTSTSPLPLHLLYQYLFSRYLSSNFTNQCPSSTRTSPLTVPVSLPVPLLK